MTTEVTEGMATGAARLAPERGWLDAGRAVLDTAGRVRNLNAPLAAWLACPTEAAAGQSFNALLVACYPEWGEVLRAKDNSTEPFEHFPLVSGRAEARQWFHCEITRFAEGAVVRLSSTLPPMTELAEGPWDEHLVSEGARREVFVRMLRAEARLHNLIAHWPGVIFSQRADYSFSFVSPKIEELTGISAEEWRRAPGRFWDVVHEGDVEELRQRSRETMRTLRGAAGTYRVRNVATRQVHYILEHRQAVVTESGLLLGYEGVWLDVTRQTLAERRLSEAAWKDTLSTITLGLAHDFSNVMAGIHSLSESFCSDLSAEHPFREGLELIQKNARLASQLVQRIAQLHHGKTGERSYNDLNALATEVFDLLRRVIPRTVEVKLEAAPAPVALYVDPVELRQVAFNLALNAAEAMPRGGRLEFKCAVVEELPPLPHWHGPKPRTPCACFRVTDTGHGIEPSALPKLFDPFFTTKAMNKGSGLGLYNVRLFAEKHGGAVDVESRPGEGATFRVWLPIADFTESTPALEPPAPKRRRTVLLVGSTPKLVESSAEVLRLWGYSVGVAAGHQELLNRLASALHPPDGLLVLVEHPGAALEAALDSARQAFPQLRVAFQIVGCNRDQLAPGLLANADLVISVDMSAEMIQRQLDQLFT